MKEKTTSFSLFFKILTVEDPIHNMHNFLELNINGEVKFIKIVENHLFLNI